MSRDYNNINTFQGRQSLSERIEREIHNIFNQDVTIVKYGVENIQALIPRIEDAFKLNTSYQSPTALSMQYLPDYILYDRKNNRVYYLDIKHSVTPLTLEKRLQTIQRLNPDLPIDSSNVGIIAREAMYTYLRFYPDTIILYFSTYNHKVSMAQFAGNVRLLYAYGWDEKTPLLNYVIGTPSYFSFSRNHFAKGSKTPHVNVYLDNFFNTTDFFNNIGISINETNLDAIEQKIISTQ